MEIIARIGVAKRPAHSLWQKYEYSGSSSILNWAEGELNGAIDKNSIVWGVYTHNKEHAKALAVVFGNTSSPEVHGSGMYGHYNDANHKLHFWFGGRLVY